MMINSPQEAGLSMNAALVADPVQRIAAKPRIAGNSWLLNAKTSEAMSKAVRMLQAHTNNFVSKNIST